MADAPAIPAPPSPPSEPGLPPVAPPSGRHILQMFLVPGLIVALIVSLMLGLQWIFGSSGSPEKILKKLDSDNEDDRWIAAADLSQRLPRDAQLAQNSWFALELAVRLKKAVDRTRKAEEEWAKEKEELKEKNPEPPGSLKKQQNYTWYLIAALGHFQVPVGAPLLCEIAKEMKGADAENVFRRRSQAVWALGRLGENLERWDALKSSVQDRIIEELQKEADSETARGKWAEETRSYLVARRDGEAHPAFGVAETLIEAARDRRFCFVRNVSAQALAFWGGSEAESVLVDLLNDDGEGTDPVRYVEAEQKYREENPREIRRLDAAGVQYTAALALAHRGSPKAREALPLYHELLDLEVLEKRLQSDAPSLKASYRANAVRYLLFTLNALSALNTKQPDFPFPRKQIDELAEHDNKEIAKAAKSLRAELK